MRLLNAHDLHFEEFYDSDIPRYAILSHRWGNEEVSFKEMRKSNRWKRRKGSGWAKIRSTCRLAIEDDLTWVWIDTCCINKDSSAELTEAINSMFRWYGRAGKCYVYLSDIHWDLHTASDSAQIERLGKSEWFSRGWTLQELLAPWDNRFYDMNWRYIGSKNDMTSLLAEITKIEPYHFAHWDRACVAQKMSWASGRRTSRVEDVAYSLLGLFDVNMPLLYGEGRKSFYRLQLEIIKQSDDESIFAWVAKDGLSHTGMLAPWPDAFGFSGSIHLTVDEYSMYHSRPPFAMTNKGLEMRLPESFIEQGGDVLHRKGPSDTCKAGVLTLHLACLGLTQSTMFGAPAQNAPIKFELERMGNVWYRRAPRLLWIPRAIHRKWTSEAALWSGFETGLDWNSDRQVTIYVRQESLNDFLASLS